MSEENVRSGGVLTPLTLGRTSRGRRTIDERVAVRFPRLQRALAAAVMRLPPRSRLRRALLARAVRRGYAASNRRDFDVVVTLYHADFEFRVTEAGAIVPPDLVGVHRGPEGFRHYWRMFLEASEDYRAEPEEMIDAGDRLLVTGRLRGHGRGSGVPFSERFFAVLTFRNGLVIRQEVFRNRPDALKAAGLSE